MTDYSSYTTAELKDLLADIISQQEDLPQHSTYAGECLQRERWEVEGELNSRVKIYKVTEINYIESNIYYFCKPDNAKKQLEKVVSDNAKAGRIQADNVDYDKANDRNKFFAVIDELSWSDYVKEVDAACMIDVDQEPHELILDWEG